MGRTREAAKIASLLGKLLDAPRFQFPSARQRISAPTKQGVYVIYSPKGRVMHVGRTPMGQKGIAQRLKNHLHARSSFVKLFLGGKGEKLRGGYCFQYLVVRNGRARALLEASAVGALCPAHIGLGLARKG